MVSCSFGKIVLKWGVSTLLNILKRIFSLFKKMSGSCFGKKTRGSDNQRIVDRDDQEDPRSGRGKQPRQQRNRSKERTRGNGSKRPRSLETGGYSNQRNSYHEDSGAAGRGVKRPYQPEVQDTYHQENHVTRGTKQQRPRHEEHQPSGNTRDTRPSRPEQETRSSWGQRHDQTGDKHARAQRPRLTEDQGTRGQSSNVDLC